MSKTEILLVEDNPADRDLTLELLGRNAANGPIHTVTDGTLAIQFLHREGRFANACTPDLVILDLNLPRKDGQTVLSEIKSDPELRSVPVVIFSSSSSPADITESYKRGANSYVRKPGSLPELTATINSIGSFWSLCAKQPRKENA